MIIRVHLLNYLLLTVSAASTANQHPLLTQPGTLSTTLVDLLASSEHHSLLLQAFQHARLIPLLNGLRFNDTTLLAPTDDAIRRANEKQSGRGIWSYINNYQAVTSRERDNMQLELRETLLYHLFNSSIFEANTTALARTNTSSSLYQSLYYPTLSAFNTTFPIPPHLPNSSEEEDPEQPKRTEGLLRGEGQKVKIIQTDKGEVWVGVSAEQEGGKMSGYKVIEDSKLEATRGALVSIDGILEKPIDLGIATVSSLSSPGLY